MILSVSRRTDIPNYYSDWFYNRIKEGYLYVRNPMNAHQISQINLSPDLVDGIVFWTKNPANMMQRLDELRDYHYCFQFTITGYGVDIEPNIPNKRTNVIKVFQDLSKKIGSEKMIWRYDPILFSDRYVPQYHLKAFEEIAAKLSGYTHKVSISLVDLYQKTKRNTANLNIKQIENNELTELILKMEQVAKKYNIQIVTCAAQNRLTGFGIKGEGCIDKSWIEEVVGCSLKAKNDKTQRKGCNCMESIDIGTYHTCKNGCKYCYANDSEEKVRNRALLFDADSPLLCGKVEDSDVITVRKIKILKETQISMFESLQ